MVKRVKTVQESDLRMLGSLARNIQRVLPVTQADIDAAAALGKGWVVWKVFEVSDPLDNLRGGTQLVIRQNSIQPGQNVRRVIFVVGPGGQTVVIRGTDYIVLPDAIANSLSYVKAFGGTEQRNIPQPYTQVNYVTNTASTAVDTGVMIDFAKNYEFEVECRAVSGSWYILQSRENPGSNITGISGSTSGNTITLVVGNVTACQSAITRTVGHKLYVKATLNAGTATLYVKDETAGTEDTKTGSYGVSQPNPPTPVYLLGNAGGNYVDINSDIYMARIKENGVTVMDYVPARQVATAGFYDTVSGTFKTAETPANLSADGNTVPTPDAPMDIVSNNGVLKWDSANQSVYTDGTVETINAHGKNLCNLETPYVFTSSSPNYTDSLTPTWCKFKENTRYTITYRFTPEEVTYSAAGNLIFTVVTYTDGTVDYNGGIKDNNLSSGIATYTTTAGKTIASIVGLYKHNRFIGGTITINSMQIEEGTTSTDYEPYYDGGTATAEMLLKVGDYQDVQSIIDGVVTRNVGVKVLDGTESISTTSSYYQIANVINCDVTNRADTICTHYKYGTATNSGEFLVLSSGTGLRINIGSFASSTDVQTWLTDQYAAGTPVIVIYPLATPTTESVAGQTLQVTDGDNVLEITQASLTGLELEAQYNAAVSLTIQEVQDANLDNNVEVTIS